MGNDESSKTYSHRGDIRVMRYLILYGAGIGDFISIIPLAQAIKKNDKDAYIVCFNVSDKRKIEINRGMLPLQDYIDYLEYYSSKELFHSIGFLTRYLFKKFDYSIMVQHEDNNSASLWPYYICRIVSKKIAGYEVKNRKEIKYDLTYPRHGMELFVNIYLKIGELITQQSSVISFPLLNTKKIEFENEQHKVKKHDIVLCIGTGKIGMRLNGEKIKIDAKNWGIDNWIELANKLSKEGYLVAIVGGTQEKDELNKSGIQFSDGVYNYAGTLSISESIGLIYRAKIVVGADTGLMHAAAALEKTSITLFGCTSEKQYLPFGPKSYFIDKKVECSPCFGTTKASTCVDHKCMSTITVDEVLDTVKDKLVSE